MRVDNLTEQNFLKFAIGAYTNIHCHGVEEFHDDLLLIKYIKRLFRRYKEVEETDPTKLRLALNHIIVFYNVFRMDAATKILFFKLESELYPILKTFLIFLNHMPAIVHGVNGQDIKSEDIPVVDWILERLKTV